MQRVDIAVSVAVNAPSELKAKVYTSSVAANYCYIYDQLHSIFASLVDDGCYSKEEAAKDIMQLMEQVKNFICES